MVSCRRREQPTYLSLHCIQNQSYVILSSKVPKILKADLSSILQYYTNTDRYQGNKVFKISIEVSTSLKVFMRQKFTAKQLASTKHNFNFRS